MLGLKHSETTKKRMSANNRKYWSGKKLTPEHRNRISKAMKGRKLSKDHKEKIGDANRGKFPSEKTKRKISEANKGKKRTEEYCQRLSERMIQYLAENGTPVSNHSVYKKQPMDSKWEKRFAIKCDKLGLKWKKAKFVSLYVSPKNGKVRRYLVDFFIKGLGYVEIKGYLNQSNREWNIAKWNAFQKKLYILVGKECLNKFLKIKSKKRALCYLRSKRYVLSSA